MCRGCVAGPLGIFLRGFSRFLGLGSDSRTYNLHEKKNDILKSSIFLRLVLVFRIGTAISEISVKKYSDS